MSTISIAIKAPDGDPSDVTDAVIFERSSFESQFNGVPGSFDIMVRDPERVLFFETGYEIALTIDSVTMFGGYITQVGMTSLAPAADTSDPDYDLRAWHLQGADYNIALDRRVFRNTADYFNAIRVNETVDGDILRAAIDGYTDMDDFSTAGIDNVATIPDINHVTIQQGWVVRKEFETLLPFSGAVYYIDGDKTIVWKAYDDAEKRWGFSDVPNYAPITASPDEYQGATYGFSQVAGTQDGTMLGNDIFVWGGSEFAGAGGTVFHRSTDTASADAQGLWQHAETHFGEEIYKSTGGVTAVANAILNGPPGTDATGQEKGLKNAQWQFTFTWFSNRVPVLSGVRDHIRAGDLVTVYLSVFDVTRLLPLRSLRISFPDALEDDGTHLVQFDGTFGLQLSDSFTLWRYILQNQNRVKVQTQAVVPPVAPDDPGSVPPSVPLGAYYSGIPTPEANGVQTQFSIPFAYIPGTTMVFRNGLLQTPGIEYTEFSPSDGLIVFASPPDIDDELFVTAYTQGGSSAGAPPYVPPGDLPTPTYEYTGDGSDLQSFINGVPNGSAGSPSVIGFEANATLNVGTNGKVQLDGRHHLVFVGRNAQVHRSNRGTTPIWDLVNNCHDIRFANVGSSGVNPAPGTWDATYEHEHGFSVFSAQNISFENCFVINVGGDGIDLSGSTFADTWSDTVTWVNGSVSGCGRNGVSFTDGIRNARILNSHFEYVGYYTFDVEPNGLGIAGQAAGAINVEIGNCTVGAHPYGTLGDANPVAGVFMGFTGSSGGGPAYNFDVHDNTMSTGYLAIIAFNNGVSCQNLAFRNNTGTGTFTPNVNGWDHAFIMSSVNGVTVTGNVQKCSPPGAFITTSGSNVTSVSGNTTS